MNQQGFTLLELLIVIAIIGMLASLGMSGFLSAQRRASDVSSLACANSLAKAVKLYQIDHPAASIPGIAEFYGSAAKEEFYGTDNCLYIDITDQSTATEFKFVVKHPKGKNDYKVTPAGISVGS